MRDFLKNIFTLKTVYIDKGSGRWATKKRFHPFMRGALSFLFLILCAGVYVNAGKITVPTCLCGRLKQLRQQQNFLSLLKLNCRLLQ